MKIQALLLPTASAAFGETTVTPTLDSVRMFNNGDTISVDVMEDSAKATGQSSPPP
jgi:hypothetical protein